MTTQAKQDLLDELERREEPLLSWGVVDGGFSENEVLEIADAWLARQGPLGDPREVVDDLERAGLLFRDAGSSPPRWRTRSAETIRLLVRLRQLLQGTRGQRPASWRTGPTLVSDFRYQRRARSYPARSRSLESVLTGITGTSADRQREVIEALATGGDSRLTLAAFQERALHRILADLDGRRSRAVVVGAGTGSGKTHAFYLPALAHVAIRVDDSAWTKVLAVYPRNELLKDQLAEAFKQARKLDPIFARWGRRKLRLGAFFGATPYSAGSLNEDRARSFWPREGGVPVCPYMSCPHETGGLICGGTLGWLEADRSARREVLTCLRCGTTIGDDELALTRFQMKASPPDIVFTTTEMLNRSISDLGSGRVFGIDAERAPNLMLLDEVHTYTGTTGAQAGMVLRRWHHRLRGAPVEFVGLSATLPDAARFFASLVGLNEDSVTYIEPASDEMVVEGAEYLLALRSDPVSGASTLSTTIQTAMLLPRCLDPVAAPLSDGLFGNRMFLFTDNLDVTNRLYYDLLDAEGQRLDSRGRSVATPGRESLATLRNPTDDSSRARRVAGQSWDLPVRLGHRLSAGERLSISRTSSQDVGVDRQAQVIVATASLDVGFNDSRVGAVLQHKAPLEAAQFLQRRGRAGRPREMRPWTVVVLSDYGRDRDAYLGWDLLFDPHLQPRSLPVSNRYVLKMHAVHSLIDWLAARNRTQLGDAAMWPLLSGPPAEGPYAEQSLTRQRVVIKVLKELLASEDLQADLVRWIAQALGITEDEAAELFWHSPRGVLLEAVPTLLRRLVSGWAIAESDRLVLGTDRRGGVPLPDFSTSNLFSDLELPEVEVLVPAQAAWLTEEVHTMAAIPAIVQYSPGRVSRRFATTNTYHRHWIPIYAATDSTEEECDVAGAYPEHAVIARVLTSDAHGVNAINLVRPYSIRTELVPDGVSDSSNSRLKWASQLVEVGEPLTVVLPVREGADALVNSLRFSLHSRQAHVEVRRFASELEAELRFKNGTETKKRISFVVNHGGATERVAIGTINYVDGLRVDVALPSAIPQMNAEEDGPAHRALRAAWFRHRVLTDSALRQHCNIFQAGWLHDALLGLLLRVALARRISLREAFEESADHLDAELVEVMNILFQRADLNELPEDESPGAAQEAAAGSRLNRFQQRMQALVSGVDVIEALRLLAPILWEDLGEDCRSWVQTRGLSTVGGALLAAARRMSPEHNPEDLVLDVEPGLREDGELRSREVWLIESTIGGGGFLEALAQQITSDPRRLLRLFRSAMSPGESEIVDVELRRIVSVLATHHGPICSAVQAYREATRNDHRQAALAEIRAALSAAGIRATHPVVAALVLRILRPGTSSATDVAVQHLIERWQANEETVGLEIDIRTWCVLASDDASLDQALDLVLPRDATDLRQWRIDAIQSILWPRGWASRADSLAEWNPFQELAPPMAEWLRPLVANSAVVVDVTGDPDGREVRQVLLRDGLVTIDAPVGESRIAADILADLVATPVDLDFLQLHPRVTEVSQADARVRVTVELQEVL